MTEPTPAAAVPTTDGAHVHEHRHHPGGNGLGLWRILLVVVLAIGLGAIAAMVAIDHGDAGHDPIAGSITGSRYQVVVLTNDKLYFGHLASLGHGWYRLSQGYILRQKAGSDPKKPAGLQVAPLSDQKIPGTDNTMLLRTESISQVQNLRRDSAVETAIRNRKG